MPGSQKPRGRSSGQLPTINPDAAGLDVGATFHAVAVPGDRDERPVRTFRSLSGDLHQLADWLTAVGITTGGFRCSRSLKPAASKCCW
jgi:transposase